MDRNDADVLDLVIEAAVARAHDRSTEDGRPPMGLVGHVLAFFRRPAAAVNAHDEPRDPRTYLAVWCDDVEPLEPTGEHALAHGHLPEGRRVRWIADAAEATPMVAELDETSAPVPVSIGSWQLV